jgi:predicted phage terminase large subunit-like protein
MRANYPQASEILIEDRANGPAIMDTLKSKISGVIPIEPDGSKESRFMAVAPQFESGNVYIPQLAEWKDEYISELVKFPVSEHNDQVDATSQALRRLGANEFNLEDLEGIQNFY